MKNHDKKVRSIQRQIKKFQSQNTKAGIDHGSSNSTRSNDKKIDSIDTSELDEVLAIDEERQHVIAEPNVSMRKLVQKTLDYGFVPPVIPEFPAITVGGAIQGGAGESGSFSHGLVHQTAEQFEIVTGDGKKLVVSESNKPDLFHGSACSYGSLGVLTRAKINLMSAKQFVHLKYHKVSGFEEGVGRCKQIAREDPDFVDGIMFGAQQGVVIEGNFSRKKDLPISRFSRAEDEWFYLHVKESALGNESYEELVPTEDYFFRYNRGAFWTGKHVFDLLHLPFTKFLRNQLDRGFRTKNMYELLHVTDLSQRYIIQDICLPEESATEFMRYIDQEHDIQPLWILPIKPDKKTPLSPSRIDTDLVINVGVWGKVNNNHFDDYMDANRDLERVVQSLGGRKVLYAQHFYSQDEFWDMYDKEQYLQLREKYNADIFPDIHDKTVVTEDYNPSIARGFIHVFKKLFSK